MKYYLSAMEERLSDDQKEMLKLIYEPQTVGVPLEDARKSMCILPDGEIRVYGFMYGDNRPYKESDNFLKPAYISSIDCGLSWSPHYSKGNMGSCTYIPEKNFFINAYSSQDKENAGTFVKISLIGPEDPAPREIKISDSCYFDMFLPQISEYSNKIWFSAQRKNDEGRCIPAFIFSDDFGESWTIKELALPDKPEVFYPHKDVRWNHGSGTEPYVAELSKSKMMMIIRTPTDFFYQSFSYDGGDTWTYMEPSVFHGTDTTAYLLKLSDGRTVAFWNNTQPLSEIRHDSQGLLKGDAEWVSSGRGEDAFTNRDANHAAITEDLGESWIGFRELHLNSVRNNSDFRYIGRKYSLDKSVHQFQAYELPYGKILVAMGQNAVSRKLIIFDINWLYENSRKETFIDGLLSVSTQVYLKSTSGCTASFGNGHCSWNRTNGAVMMPDPEGRPIDCVLISKYHDDRLLNDIQGVVWNFPASKQGEVYAEIKIIEKRVRISLSDRWFNPCDEYAGALSQFTFELDNNDIGNSFNKITIKYDTDTGISKVYNSSRLLFNVKINGNAKCGLSYIIIQCATDGDSKGAYLRSLEKN